MKITFKNRVEVFISMSFSAAITITLVFGCFKEYTSAFAMVLLHEMSHIFTAKLMGCKIYSIKIMAIGLNAEINDIVCERNKRIAIYLSGPAMNVLMAGMLFILNTYYFNQSNNMRFLIYVNLYIAIFNLIPVLPLDGGKILREILVDRIGIYSAHAHIITISRAVTSLMIAAGILQFYAIKQNLSLLITGIYIMFNIKWGKAEVGFMNIKNVFYRRARILKKGIYPSRDLVVMKWLNLSDIIKQMDYDRFHIVHVLDDDLNIIKTLTEQEIIDGMLNSEKDISFEEFLKLTK